MSPTQPSIHQASEAAALPDALSERRIHHQRKGAVPIARNVKTSGHNAAKLINMIFNKVRWPLAIAGLLAAEASLIAAAFAWVAIYSYLLNPGHTAGFYEHYAQATTPSGDVGLRQPGRHSLVRSRQPSRQTSELPVGRQNGSEAHMKTD